MLTQPELARQISDCHACELRASCHRPVPGQGPVPARLMIVGEAPGATEDRFGLPFQGRCGQYFRQLLEEFISDTPYVTNTVKCRPSENRPPKSDEIAACQHHLRVEVAVHQPKLIVAVGKWAAVSLIEAKKSASMKNLIGRWWQNHWCDEPIPVRVIWHPSYVMQYGRKEVEIYRGDLEAIELFMQEN